MGIVKGPDHYNSHRDRVMLPLEESPWRDVYEAATSLLPINQEDAVIADIGCGTGRFAKLLSNKGYKRYWGVDFSETRVNEARNYVPEMQFSVGNICVPWVIEKLKEFNTFVLLEVLEHINDDLAMLSVIPTESRVIFSVPNYDSKAYVRYFNNIDDVIKRYDSLIVFAPETISTIKRKKPSKMIFLFSGTRR